MLKQLVENFPEDIKGFGVKGENGKIVVNQRSYISSSVVNLKTPFHLILGPFPRIT